MATTRKKRINQHCEFCGDGFYTREDLTVCERCDLELKRIQTEEHEARAKAWADKHKCKSCRDGLPLTRAIYCETCVRPDERTDDEYGPKRSGNWRVHVQAKQCSMCKEIKDRSQFANERAMKTGLSSACLKCRYDRLAARKSIVEEQSNASVL